MTRARKVDHNLLEREYIYDSGNPPISITQLSDNHGLARSHVADLARRGKWYEKRKEVRTTVGEKVIDAMTDRWAETQTIVRERMLALTVSLLDQAEKAVAAGEVRITKMADIQSIVATIRVLQGDQAVGESAKNVTPIDLEAVEMDPAKMAEMLPLLKQLMAGGVNGTDTSEPGHPRTDAAAGAEGTLQD